MYNIMVKLLNIIDSYEDQSATEVLVADYILRNIENVPAMSIYQLAEACHTSPATISRFCKKLGDMSYKELKENCQSVREYQSNEINKDILQQSSHYTDINENFNMMINSLIETKKLINWADIEKTVTLFENAQKIAFFGIGYSHFAAREAQYKFTRLGKYCTAYSNFDNQLREAKRLTNKDVAFIISFSGATSFIVNLKNIMQKHGIKVIALTSEPDSYITIGADVILRVSSLQNKLFNSPIIQDLSIMSMINSIYLAYIGRMK
ncbi:MurR/RpiR family transcriptional regulator [Caldifermentibacillus hisashii]|uniref:MurR/RpiR family transcriptional regulator n=1 Tax=Caldifermentibacillus hisashii TaxID=996558 RepID=UPI0031FBC0F8